MDAGAPLSLSDVAIARLGPAWRRPGRPRRGFGGWGGKGKATWKSLIPATIHASWLNQIEIYFSSVQRKVLTPNDFASLAEVEERLLRFQERYKQIAQPFQRKFTRQDLTALLAKLETGTASLPLAA